MPKTKMGRPPKPKGEAKNEILTLRLTSPEKKAVERAAKQLRLPVSEWARLSVLEAALGTEDKSH